MFQPSGDAAPSVMVIAIIDYLKTGLGSVPDTFVHALGILALRENIGIAIKYHGSNPMIHKAFYYGG